MRDSIILNKSKAFALRIIKLYKYLNEAKREYILSKQLLRCGTSIGANVKEAVYAQSKADFTAKLFIAQKECAETEYWIELLYESEYINKDEFDSIYEDCQELMKLIVASTKTLQGRNNS
ncbi:MAG: four helix bundle protein [Bacteroidales bacterium]|jgi:four helix bundle protein|nr:four helix bundle protein [Bacteroidales bacterium]